jgi:EAL domain-containing protein (putative c-di-GMP-specific phosphodiesterase class I)
VRVAIDDFGADHSSLARLRALRVDILKIDRDFLRGVPEEHEAAAIVTAVLALASALGMSAVAEGVETGEQMRFLQGLGCDRVQGYHIARPMPVGDATGYLHRHPPVIWRRRHLHEVA